MTHTIAAIHFDHYVDSRQAPMRCSCGWDGVLADWEQHRADMRQQRGRRQMPQGGRPGLPFRLWVRKPD